MLLLHALACDQAIREATMARYQIVETPGKLMVYPDPDNPDHAELTTQDQANIVIAQLRAQAKADHRKVDYYANPIKSASKASTNGAGGGNATSVRLSEDNRAAVARFIGQKMMETGEPMTMGEGVNLLITHYQLTSSFVDNGELNDEAIIAYAKAVIKARKAEREAA